MRFAIQTSLGQAKCYQTVFQLAESVSVFLPRDVHIDG